MVHKYGATAAQQQLQLNINKLQDRALRIIFNTDIITDTAYCQTNIHNFSETVAFQTVIHVYRMLTGNSGISIPFTIIIIIIMPKICYCALLST